MPSAAAPAATPRALNPGWLAVGAVGTAILLACVLLFQRAQEEHEQRLARGEVQVGGDSVIGTGPFREVVTTQEQPEIRVTDETGDTTPSYLVFQANGREFVMTLLPPGASLKLDPGVYRYELRGPQYLRTRQPDQYGSLACRKFRRYDLVLTVAPLGSYPQNQDLGDPG